MSKIKRVMLTKDEIMQKHSIFKFFGEYGAIGVGGDNKITYYDCSVSSSQSQNAHAFFKDEKEYVCELKVTQ